MPELRGWRTIVVAFDDTEPARRALARGAELARTADSILVVTSVARLLPSGATKYGVGPTDPADSLGEHERELQHAEELLRAEGVAATFELSAGGDIADAVIAVAQRHGADLIVAGTHEPDLVERIVAGSTSQAIARHAHCDVLIVH